MTIKELLKCSVSFTGLLAISALACGQVTNTIVATEGSNSGNAFSVNLEKTGSASDVAGYSFLVEYDLTQVDVVGVKDASGQPRAGQQLSLGQASIVDGSTTAAQRIIMSTTLSNLSNPTKLVEVQLEKKPGYVGPLYLRLDDRSSTPTVDGLLGADLKNIPHNFDTSQVTK